MAAGASLVLLLAVMATTAPQADAVAKNFVNASMPTLRPTFVVNFDMATVICQGSADPTDLHLHDINILCDGKKDCYDSPAMHDEIFPYCEGTCSPECSKHGACLNDGEKTLCFCNAGFHGQACELLDNNECSDKPCHWLAHCWNTYGSYKCNCFPGFNGDGYHCLDNDECQMAAASCPEHSECINLPGTYLCNCTEGFAPKGLPLKKCEDIDECKEGIDGCEMRKTGNEDPFKCQNSVGSFQCVQNCDPGFIEQNGTCVDIDDCALSPCHHRASCKNLPPPLTFACSCEDGLDGDGINVCKANGSVDCVSDASICDRHANCDRAMKTCSCESGYAGDGTTCDDVDECRETSVCKDDERCLNLEGWYICCGKNSTDEKCREDHGVTDCVNGCGANAECTMGECKCKLGYEGFPLIKCEDVDECMNEGICSNMKEWCVNTDGGFHCCFDGSPQQDCKGLAIESGPDGKVGLYTFGPPIGESTGLPLNVEVTTAVPAINATETSNETSVNLPVEREVIAVTSTPILFTIKPVTNSTERVGDETEILPEENVTGELIKVLEEVAGPESANLTSRQLVPSDLNTAQNMTVPENDIELNTSAPTLSIPEETVNKSEASASSVADKSFIPAIKSLDVRNDSSALTNDSTMVELIESVTMTARLDNETEAVVDVRGMESSTEPENDIERNTSTLSIPEKAMNESEASASPAADQSFIPAIQFLDVYNDSSALTNESNTVSLVDSVMVTTRFDNGTEARIDVSGTQSPTEDPAALILNGGSTDEMTTSAAIVEDGAKSKTTATPVDGEFGIEIGQGNTNDSSNANASAKVGDGKSTSSIPNNETSSEGISTAKNTSEVNPDVDTMSIDKGTEASNVTSEAKPHDDKLPIDKGTSVSNDTSQEQPAGDKQPIDKGVGGTSDSSETKPDGGNLPIDKETGNTSESSATKPDGEKQPIDEAAGITSNSSEAKTDSGKLPIDKGSGGTTDPSETKPDGDKQPIDKGAGGTSDSSETKPDGDKLPIDEGTGGTTNTSETKPDGDKLPIDTDTKETTDSLETKPDGNKQSIDNGTGNTSDISETKSDSDKLPIDKGAGGTTNTSETKPDGDKLQIEKGTGGAKDLSERKPDGDTQITSKPNDEGVAAANETSEEKGDQEFGLEISSVANDTSDTKTNESNVIKPETGTNNLKQTTVSSTGTNETDDGDQEFGLEISSVTNDTSDTKTNKGNATKPEVGIGNLEQTTVLPSVPSPPGEIDGEFGLEISSVANDTSSSTTNTSNAGMLETDASNLKQTTVSTDVSNMTTGIDGEFGLEISAGKATSANGTEKQSSSKPSTEKLPVESVTETVAVGGETVEPRTTSGGLDDKQPPTTVATDQRTSIADKCRSDNDCGADSFCERRTGVCRCQPGFNRINSEGPCIDIDECARGSAKCDSSSTCVNFVGGYDCRCDGAGYRKKGRICVDIDECVEKSDHCDTTAKCVNTDSGYSCQCPSQHTAVGKYGCLPTNEKLCSNEEMKTHQCTEHSICVVLSDSSVKCTDRCKNGYIMNIDGKCEDVNECDSGKKCSLNAECTNTEGSFECNCLSGYVGNGFVCEDQDECSSEAGSPCHPQATCINTIGSFTCGCPKGWSGDGVSNCYNPSDPRCRDVATACNGVSEGVSCITTGDKNQHAVCQCSNGYRWNPVAKKCQDINECAENRYNCDGPSTQCVNEEGSYSCRCRKGYSGTGNRCEDIDECGLGTSGCDVSATCVNTQGSFKCSCKAGFTGDGKSCKEVIKRKPCSDASIVNCRASNKDCRLRSDGGESCEGCLDGFEPKGNICQPRTSARMCAEPAANDCDANADCIDVAPGKHFCACRAGYIGDGQHCDDADECNLAPDICGTKSTCVNTLGGYRCFCDIGYVKRLRGDGVILCEAFSSEGQMSLCPGAGTPNENSKPCAPGQLDCPKGFFCEKALCCPKPEPNNCFFNRKLCHTNANCVDGHCRCNTGYDGDGIAKCTDRSICAGKCHTRAVCLEDGNCHCWGNGDALTTCDIDPLDCVIDPDICHAELGYCNRQRRRCFCKDGSYGNGKYCTKNENDCSARPEICSNDAVCIEHRCDCRDGYSGNGRECVSITDVTPCAECDSNAECISDKCVCKSGFKGDGKTCVYEKAIAPCADCHFNAVCLSDVCVCNSGYLGDGKSCVPDREDCQIYPGLCHSNAECRSDIRRCTCKEGFTGDGERCDIISRTCETQPDLCHENAYCANGTCICKRNFSGDGIVDCVAMNDTLSVIGSTESVTTRTQGPPILLNRCETVRVSCHKNADCRNINTNAEGYECVCKAGFHGDGQSCQDINECETFANCHPNARCENTMGSYACVCKPGFRGDGSRACVKADDPLDVSVSCEPDGIVLKVLKTDGFSGRMYVKGQSDNKFCSRQFGRRDRCVRAQLQSSVPAL